MRANEGTIKGDWECLNLNRARFAGTTTKTFLDIRSRKTEKSGLEFTTIFAKSTALVALPVSGKRVLDEKKRRNMQKNDGTRGQHQ